jgi:hypothetical protein
MDIDKLVTLWLRSENIRADRFVCAQTHLDVLHRRRLVGCVAIKFCDTILLNGGLDPTKLPDNLIHTIEMIGEHEGYESHEIEPRLMTRLRGFLGNRALRGHGMAKFRSLLPNEIMGDFPQLDHRLAVANHARLNSAFYHRGSTTHILVREEKSAQFIVNHFESADDAVLELLKLDNPANHTVIDIRGTADECP